MVSEFESRDGAPRSLIGRDRTRAPNEERVMRVSRGIAGMVMIAAVTAALSRRANEAIFIGRIVRKRASGLLLPI